jgi:Protein of unknown function (DUF3224)
MFRRHLYIGSVALALIAVPFANPVRSAASDHMRTLKLTTSSVSGAPTIGAPTCDPSGHCQLGYAITSTFSGDLTGTSKTDGVTFVDPATLILKGTSMNLFSGSVKGCGTGTFVMHYPLFDGVPGPYSVSGVILEGSGTGDLVGITGTLDSDYVPDPVAPTSQTRLKVRCAAGDPASKGADRSDS